MTQYNYYADISNWFFIVFLIGTILSSTTSNILEWKNSCKGNIKEKLKNLYKLNPLMKKFFPKSKIDKAMEYNETHSKFSEMTSSIGSGITTFCLLMGLCPFLVHGFITLLPNCHISVCYILCSLTISTLKTLISIPFSYYSVFKIEEDYGFNNMTKKLFFMDIIKSFLVSFVINSLMIFGINYILTMTDSRYTYIQIGYFALGMVFLNLFFEFIGFTTMKIFNRFEPLKDKILKSKLSNLLKKYGYSSKNIFVMDGSKRSTHANAFVCGFGKKGKKIVLFDTLLKKYSAEEITAIIAHELAHAKLFHLLISRTISIVTTIISVYVTFYLIYNVNLYHAFGFNWITEDNIVSYSMIGFVLSSLFLGSLKWIMTPLTSYISRKMEYAADSYAVKYTRKKQPMISALIKLTSENLSDVFPEETYEKFYYDHPSIQNRIRNIKETKLK